MCIEHSCADVALRIVLHSKAEHFEHLSRSYIFRLMLADGQACLWNEVQGGRKQKQI